MICHESRFFPNNDIWRKNDRNTWSREQWDFLLSFLWPLLNKYNCTRLYLNHGSIPFSPNGLNLEFKNEKLLFEPILLSFYLKKKSCFSAYLSKTANNFIPFAILCYSFLVNDEFFFHPFYFTLFVILSQNAIVH